jgi:hypothetical protein
MGYGYEENPFDEDGLITKLGSINAMIERASTDGERAAAENARNHMLKRLQEMGVAPQEAERRARQQREAASAPRNRPRPGSGGPRPGSGRARPRPRPRPARERPQRPPNDDFDIPSDLSPKAKKIAKAIVTLAKRMFGSDTSGGGCRAFYSPEDWVRKEGRQIDDEVVLVVVHDGGDMGPLFNYDYLGSTHKRAKAALKKLNTHAENQGSWYTFIYADEPVRASRPRPAAKPRPSRARPASPPRASRRAPAGDPFAGKKKVKKSDLRVGQKVFFRYRSELMTGKITKLNQKTANLVQTNNMKQYNVDAGEEWNISYTELRV